MPTDLSPTSEAAVMALRRLLSMLERGVVVVGKLDVMALGDAGPTSGGVLVVAWDAPGVAQLPVLPPGVPDLATKAPSPPGAPPCPSCGWRGVVDDNDDGENDRTCSRCGTSWHDADAPNE